MNFEKRIMRENVFLPLPRFSNISHLRNNEPRWVFAVSTLTRLSARRFFWKRRLRPEFKRGQISCPFQGSGRFRIMRFIDVLRNAVKTGDEYPNRDGRGDQERDGRNPMKLIDEKEKFDTRAIFKSEHMYVCTLNSNSAISSSGKCISSEYQLSSRDFFVFLLYWLDICFKTRREKNKIMHFQRRCVLKHYINASICAEFLLSLALLSNLFNYLIVVTKLEVIYSSGETSSRVGYQPGRSAAC